MSDQNGASRTSAGEVVHSPIEAARSDYELACYLQADLDSRLEHAIMAGDQDLRAHLNSMIKRTAGLRHRLWDRLHALTVASGVVAFEDILRDPTSQMDPEGMVMRSILAYQNAPSGTACACGKCAICRATNHCGYCTLPPLHDGPCGSLSTDANAPEEAP